jgi:hypothetical protein
LRATEAQRLLLKNPFDVSGIYTMGDPNGHIAGLCRKRGPTRNDFSHLKMAGFEFQFCPLVAGFDCPLTPSKIGVASRERSGKWKSSPAKSSSKTCPIPGTASH